jgi:hypothetical protein
MAAADRIKEGLCMMDLHGLGRRVGGDKKGKIFKTRNFLLGSSTDRGHLFLFQQLPCSSAIWFHFPNDCK